MRLVFDALIVFVDQKKCHILRKLRFKSFLGACHCLALWSYVVVLLPVLEVWHTEGGTRMLVMSMLAAVLSVPTLVWIV